MRSVDSQDLNIARNAVGAVRIDALPLSMSIAQNLALILTGPCHSETIPIILSRQVFEMERRGLAAGMFKHFIQWIKCFWYLAPSARTLFNKSY
jgi:hypothetical protein